MEISDSHNKKTGFSKPEGILSSGYSGRLLLSVLCVFIAATLFSSIFFYIEVNRPLSTHYSAVVSILTDIHQTLMFETLKINTVFFILMFGGVMILGILYTHRIVGPLHRVKLSAKSVSRGKLDTKITFRNKDAIHAFGDAFNEMTENHSDRIKMLASEVKHLRTALTDLKSLTDEGKDTEAEVRNIIDIDRSIERILSAVKL